MSIGFLNRYPLVLGEGSMYERLRRGASASFDPYIAHAGMIYDEIGRQVLLDTHCEYLDIGQQFGVPMVAGTPTWRATADRISKSRFAGRSVNTDAYAFMTELKESYGPDASPILIAGVTGPFGDGYLPEEAPDTLSAIALHTPQIEELAQTGIDFFKAQTLPSFPEAKGIAQVLSSTGLPYVLSFVVRPDGCILDGTPIDLAIVEIDNEAQHPPVNYAINCVHASVFSSTYRRAYDRNKNAAQRIVGIDANTSTKTPEELEGLEEIDTEAPQDFGTNLATLRRMLGISYLGGCCGSSTSHMNALAAQLNT
ncbi:homocysteine S-methyltransferase family protein [uncultured Ruegeria sp.]|uniref:homocysteine S-methyltransferase family protein n=1 Tax=uncultured Ruegeria sp. TaxID=259304 RepID=UPI002608C90A|nr:homocysteine S-methyltransferase family protein [uncultured Ruegeria sp.]